MPMNRLHIDLPPPKNNPEEMLGLEHSGLIEVIYNMTYQDGINSICGG